MSGSPDVLTARTDVLAAPADLLAAPGDLQRADLRALEWLTGRSAAPPRAEVTVSIEVADADTPVGRRRRAAHAALRRQVFVEEQGVAIHLG